MKDLIRIESNGGVNPMDWRVFMNGEDISGMVSGFTVEVGIDQPPRVTLHLVTAIEIVGEFPADVEKVV